MHDTVEIKHLPEAGVYRLLLPEPVITALRLTAADGDALFIIHENKMQLEWLGQRIWQQYHTLKNKFTAGEERQKRKKRLAVALLVLAGLTAIFSASISRLARISILYINASVITVGVFCCLQLLQYFAKGFFPSGSDLVSGQEISELKKSILTDYSP